MIIPAVIQFLGTLIPRSVQACSVSVVLGWFVDSLHPSNGKDMSTIWREYCMCFGHCKNSNLCDLDLNDCYFCPAHLQLNTT